MDENRGGELNMQNAMLRATAPHLVYLADDDILDIDTTKTYLSFLASNPSVVALYAPWFLTDLVNGERNAQFYQQPDHLYVERGNYRKALSFVLDNGIFPEVYILRSEIARRRLIGHRFVYVFFSWLVQALEMGDVVFGQVPFYEAITVHPAGAPNRTPAGVSQTMDSWDLYRGGFELLLSLATKQGTQQDSEADTWFRLKLNDLIVSRMLVALRLNIAHAKFLDAYWLFMRLGAQTMEHHAMINYEVLLGLGSIDYIFENYVRNATSVCLCDSLPLEIKTLAHQLNPDRYRLEKEGRSLNRISFERESDSAWPSFNEVRETLRFLLL
jgi:hypothetical protein